MDHFSSVVDINHFFIRAARLFPVGISQIITDNGKEFLGSFDKTLQEAAIKHLWTYPYTPKMNAICERFNRTLREQFIEFNEILLFEDLALFNQKLAEYLVPYNSKRPHKALALMTPVEYILKLQYVVGPHRGLKSRDKFIIMQMILIIIYIYVMVLKCVLLCCL